MDTVNLRRLKEAEAKNKAELQQCEAFLQSIINDAAHNKASVTWETFEQLTEYLSKSSLTSEVRNSISAEARRHTFSAHRSKIQELLETAHEMTRIGDPMKKMVALKIAAQCLENARKLTGDKDFVTEVQRRIELARETSKAGDSAGGKTFVADRNQGRGLGNEKRRFLRYAAPRLLMRIGRDGAEYRSKDFSMNGLLIDGIPNDLREGQKIPLMVRVEGDAKLTTYSGNATVARILSDQGAVGLEFTTADGPTMFFVRERVFDLGLLDAI